MNCQKMHIRILQAPLLFFVRQEATFPAARSSEIFPWLKAMRSAVRYRLTRIYWHQQIGNSLIGSQGERGFPWIG